MLRILLYRSFWAALLFSFGMVCLVSAVVVPTVDRHFLFLSFLLTTVLSLGIQVTQPLILVLRRSIHESIDVTLADVVLPFGCTYGRPIWLENPYDDLVRGSSARYSPYALVGQLATLGVQFVWLVPRVGMLYSIGITVLCLVGSTKLLDASVGNSAAGGVAFLTAAAVSGPLPTMLPPAPAIASGMIHWIVVFTAIYVGFHCFGYAKKSIWGPIEKTIRRRQDLCWLRFEMWLPLCFITRYVHGGPAVVREVCCVDNPIDLWKEVVDLLMRRSSHAIVDISELRPDSGLEWEIKTCFARRINLLATCHERSYDGALLNLRRALPAAMILPHDLRDFQKWKQLLGKRIPVVLCCAYGDEDVADRIYPFLTVFFGGTAGLLVYLEAQIGVGAQIMD